MASVTPQTFAWGIRVGPIESTIVAAVRRVASASANTWKFVSSNCFSLGR